MSGIALLDHFSALSDPRQARKVIYPLPEVLLLVLCGTIAGAQNFLEIGRWGERKLDFLRRLRRFGRGIPSHDTLGDVIDALDARLFSECFIARVAALRETAPDIVAIDGKTSRRARRGGAHPLHLVSAWASRQRLVIGQEAVAGKSPGGGRRQEQRDHRHPAAAGPLLLDRLELTGALVTIDAIGCQRRIAEAILGKGADYLLALKDNWPTLAGEVRLFFDTASPDAVETHQTTDADHGRIEVRRHVVSHDVGWLGSDRRFPGEPRFPALAGIGMVEATVERNGTTSVAGRYYLSSAKLSAAVRAHAVRAHWGIENRLHWVMDVVFHDDLMRPRTDHGPANMATVRHAALNLIQAIQDKASLAVKRKTAAWDDDDLYNALTNRRP